MEELLKQILAELKEIKEELAEINGRVDHSLQLGDIENVLLDIKNNTES